MSLRIEPFRGSPEEWNSFGRSRSGWTHFHSWEWQRVIAETFGHECRYYAARGPDGALSGILPLVRVRSRIFGHYLVSMPFLNYGGPLGTTEAVRQLCATAVEEAERSGAKLLELRSAVELPIDLPVSHRKITVVLDLPDDEDTLWKGLPSKLRSQIRRPTKDGVTMRWGHDQVDPFYRVFATHMRDLGTPVLPRKFFERIVHHFPDSARVAVACFEDKPVACGLAFRFGDEMEITWASSLLEVKRIAPNMLVYWEMLQTAVREGVRRFNFGRCTPGGGTHRFKQQWGGQDEPLFWYQYGRGTHTPSPEDGVYALGARLWQRMPVPLATALGPRIVKFIP